MRTQPRVRQLLVYGATLLLLTGCVVAPVPLIETEIHHIWWGKDIQGRGVAIEVQVKNWFLPVLVSPEGSSKIPTSKYDYRYYWLRTENYWVPAETKERVELPFLRLEGVEFGGWQIRPLRGSTYLLAEKITASGPGKDYSPPPETVQVEYVVFEGPRLLHRRTLNSLAWPGRGTGNPVWDRFKEDGDGRYVIYKSAEGLQRYDLWRDSEEPLTPGKETN